MTSRFLIRRATSADLDAAKWLRCESLSDSPDAFGSLLEDTLLRDDEWWMSWMSSGATFIAREIDAAGHGVGIVRIAALEELPDEVAMVHSMWVAPRARGAGVGESLLSECVAWARNLGFVEVRLAVVAGNPHAVGLYQRCGFGFTGHEEVRERDAARIVEMSRVIASEQTSNG